MTSIAFYHTLDEERPFAEQWATDHNVRVECFPFELHDDTLDAVQGFDGISYKQRCAPSDDPDFYRRLRAYGIRQIALRSAGYDTINLNAAHANGLRITNVPSYSPTAVAELTLTHIMQLIRHVPQFDSRMRRHDFSIQGLMSPEISELTIGIIGVGRIGSTVARIFHSLGATVIGNDITENHNLDTILTWTSRDNLLATADVVTLHTWLDDTTRHLIDKHSLSLMKPTAYLANLSRGAVVDTQALIDALQNHRIAGAAIDVLENEAAVFGNRLSDDKPVPHNAYNTLRTLPNAIITPHVAFFTDHAVRNMVQQSLNDALTIITGGTSPHEIQPER
ncbi:NAD(P)-dependent oxidoreductase [Bifidobacterium biavatii]|nr:NAD(P)-dependent oxidoreductase [Bifidobacterium biavatii]